MPTPEEIQAAVKKKYGQDVTREHAIRIGQQPEAAADLGLKQPGALSQINDFLSIPGVTTAPEFVREGAASLSEGLPGPVGAVVRRRRGVPQPDGSGDHGGGVHAGRGHRRRGDEAARPAARGLSTLMTARGASNLGESYMEGDFAPGIQGGLEVIGGSSERKAFKAAGTAAKAGAGAGISREMAEALRNAPEGATPETIQKLIEQARRAESAEGRASRDAKPPWRAAPRPRSWTRSSPSMSSRVPPTPSVTTQAESQGREETDRAGPPGEHRVGQEDQRREGGSRRSGQDRQG